MKQPHRSMNDQDENFIHFVNQYEMLIIGKDYLDYSNYRLNNDKIMMNR